jgi:PAS domain S-box-containing protein
MTAPTGTERTFGRDEVIVSKTDLQGRLTYCNDVFCRVSAYDEAGLLGRPHNIIRHPDMPGSVFKLLWNTIERGEEIFAYVLNLAADGAHYWVLAHVTPSFDAAGTLVGHHSNRRLPARGAIREVEPVYRTLVAEERRYQSGPEAATAGLALLHRLLDEQDTTYEAWVWDITNRYAA